MKKIFAIIISVLIIISSSVITNAKAAPISEIVLAKQSLAAAHADKYIKNYSETAEAGIRKNNIAELICKMQANILDESSVCAELEALGVYKLDTDIQKNDASILSSEPGDIKMNNTIVMFDSYTGQWIVGGGGSWSSDSAWLDDVPLNFFPTVGQTLNVGGYDGVGIKLYNTSGTYNTSVKESYLYYSDGDNDYYNYNPSICEGNKGAYFQFQDKARVLSTSGLVSSYAYTGKHFSVIVTYDSNFTNFNGYARTQYTHTWSNAQISGVSFGASTSSASFSVTIENSSKSFNCYSTGETVF